MPKRSYSAGTVGHGAGAHLPGARGRNLPTFCRSRARNQFLFGIRNKMAPEGPEAEIPSAFGEGYPPGHLEGVNKAAFWRVGAFCRNPERSEGSPAKGKGRQDFSQWPLLMPAMTGFYPERSRTAPHTFGYNRPTSVILDREHDEHRETRRRPTAQQAP